MIKKTRRPHEGVLFIFGPQAETFLQGQLTCDVTSCPTMGGYCNTQGRLISIFQLSNSPFEDQQGYWLTCPLDILDSTLKTFKKYALFSKVTFKNISEQIEVEKLDGLTDDEQVSHWKSTDILAKIPQLSLKTQALFLPHHLNLPELGAVSFKKGCYLGQEIIARMHYKSKIKKHLAILEAVDPVNIGDNLEAGSPIYSTTLHNNEPVGHIVTISHKLILASLLDEALNTKLRAGTLTGPYLTGRI